MTEDRLSEAFREHGRRIYRFCLVRTGSKADAEDITAEAFARLTVQGGRIAERATLTWLYRVAANLCVDHARMRRRLTPLENGAGTDDSLGTARVLDRSASGRGDGRLAERMDARDALAKLRPLQQQVVYLRAVEDLPFREIAGLLGRSEAAIKMRYRRALDELGRMLEVDDDE